VAAEPRGAKIKKRLAIDPVEAEVLRLMFRLFRERDGKSGSMGVKAVTICPLCHTRALLPTFVLEWRKFGAPEEIRTLVSAFGGKMGLRHPEICINRAA
jgi:hypothetical protein